MPWKRVEDYAPQTRFMDWSSMFSKISKLSQFKSKLTHFSHFLGPALSCLFALLRTSPIQPPAAQQQPQLLQQHPQQHLVLCQALELKTMLFFGLLLF